MLQLLESDREKRSLSNQTGRRRRAVVVRGAPLTDWFSKVHRVMTSAGAGRPIAKTATAQTKLFLLLVRSFRRGNERRREKSRRAVHSGSGLDVIVSIESNEFVLKFP
jgi:hypothetical protein